MSFSTFLLTRKKLCQDLVQELSNTFSYVSILGVDTKAMNYSSNKAGSNVSEGDDTDSGFVCKMTNGKGFFEYAFNDFEADIKDFAEKIISKVSITKDLEKKMISAGLPADDPLEEDFLREGDFSNYTTKDILSFLENLKADIFTDNHIKNVNVMLRTLEVNKIFVSKNRTLTQHYTWANGYLMAAYFDGKMVMPRCGCYDKTISKVLEVLPTLKEDLFYKGSHLAKATTITPGVYTCITDPSISGLIAHEAFGHGVEMDQFVKDRALAKKFVGDYVASPITNMRDGAASTLSVASYFFDDDGVLAHDTQIIKDGILVSGLSDMVSALQLGTNPTGNGRRQSFSHKAYTRMTNTFFDGGNDELEDMIKSVKHGYMLFETNNGMEDPKNWAIQCVCEYGIEIVDGKLTDNWVTPVVMSGYVPDLLKSISMISKDVTVIGSGGCGKGYKEWVRVSDGGPALKVEAKLS